MEFLPFYDASDPEFDLYFHQNYRNLPKNGDLSYDNTGEWVFYDGAWYISNAADQETNNQEFEIPNNPENYDLRYDADGEWSYYNDEWLLSRASGYNPLDYPPLDAGDYDDPDDL